LPPVRAPYCGVGFPENFRNREECSTIFQVLSLVISDTSVGLYTLALTGKPAMITELSNATSAHGQAAAASAQTATVPGFVLSPAAMPLTLDERMEQVNNLLKVRDEENNEAVAEDLRDVILTVQVPEEVEDALESAFNKLPKPLLMRLSPIGPIADPLGPTMVVGLQDMKSALDALRMLYAGMHSAENLSLGSGNHETAIIVQPLTHIASTYRVLRSNQFTVVEATHGLGAWVGYGEPDRFLFEGDELKKEQPGDNKAVLLTEGKVHEGKRTPTSNDAARAAFDFAKQFAGDAPILLARKIDGELVSYGSLSPE
jgi:hypothetical protein